MTTTTLTKTGRFPNHGHPKRSLVEVSTHDSPTCAACTYMGKPTLDAKARLGESIDVIESPCTSAENTRRCMAMGVTAFASLSINESLANGQLVPNRGGL